MPHRKLAGDHRLDARLASAIGRLFFSGQLTEQQYNAGLRYEQVALAYLQSIDAPEPYGSGFDDVDDEACMKRKLAYAQARHLMPDNLARRFVDKLVIYEELPTDYAGWDALRRGLNALAGQ